MSAMQCSQEFGHKDWTGAGKDDGEGLDVFASVLCKTWKIIAGTEERKWRRATSRMELKNIK
jgi:hypothetical protein